MGSQDRLKKAYEFVMGEPSKYLSREADLLIRASLRINAEAAGPIGVAGPNVPDIFARVTGEALPEEWKEKSPQEVQRKMRRELHEYGVLPVILPEPPAIEPNKSRFGN